MTTRLVTRARAAVPVVNLLPPEYAEQEQMRRLQLKLAGTVLLALVVLAGLYLNAHEAGGAVRSQLEASRAVQSELATEQAKYADVPATRQRLLSAETVLAQAMTQEIRWSTYLRDLARSVPKGVWLTELTGAVLVAEGGAEPAADTGLGTVTFLGKAKKYEDVANWLDALEKQRGYANAWSSDLKKEEVQSGQPGTPGEELISFTSSVTLTEDALHNAASGNDANGGTE